MVKCAYFSNGLDVLKTKKNKKMCSFSMALGGGRVTIFRLLGILLKITNGTNSKMWILSEGFDVL